MPTPADQLPGDAASLARRVADLERVVNELRAARRLESASIGGGGLAIVDGGRLTMTTPDGHRMVDIGAINNAAYNHLDGTVQQATFLRRENATVFLSCFSPGGSDGAHQFWTLWDNQVNTVVADDAVSGQGLARPYLPLPMYPAFDGAWATWPAITGTTMASLWSARFYKQQPRVFVIAQAAMDTVGATGSLQLAINGTPMEDPQTVTFGAGYYSFGPYSLADYPVHMTQLDASLQGRRDTGTGGIRATIYAAYTLQS